MAMRFSGAGLAVLIVCSGMVWGMARCDAAPANQAAAPEAETTPSAPPAAIAKPEAPAAEERPPADLKLLDAGQEPRELLRYAPKVGQKQTVNVTITNISAAHMMGEKRSEAAPSAPVVFTIETEVKDIDAEGNVRYVFGITEATAVEVRGVKPLDLKGKRELVAMLVGVTGTSTINNRGFTKEAGIVIPPTVNKVKKHVAMVLQNIRNALEQNWLLLPEEPVGAGAKWQVISQSDANGNFARIKQISTYELISASKGNARVKMEVIEGAGRQALPAFQNGIQQSLVSHEGQGTGSMDLELSKVMPLLSSVTIEARTEIEIDLSGNAQHIMSETMVENKIETFEKPAADKSAVDKPAATPSSS